MSKELKSEGYVGTSGGLAFVHLNAPHLKGKLEFPVGSIGPLLYNQRAEVSVRLIGGYGDVPYGDRPDGTFEITCEPPERP